MNNNARYSLSRDWFLPVEETKITYADDPIFSQIGRDIALGERKYLENKILETKEIQWKEIEFSAGSFLEAVSVFARRKLLHTSLKPIPKRTSIHSFSRFGRSYRGLLWPT